MIGMLIPAGWIARPDVPAVALGGLVVAGLVIFGFRRSSQGSAVALALGAVLVPAAYAEAVAEAAAARLRESLGQGRIVRAQRQAAILASLRPWARVQGMPLPRLQAELDAARTRLRRRAAAPFSAGPALGGVRQRVVALLQLERPDEALLLLEPLSGSGDPFVLDAIGLCYQRLDQPRASLDAYQRCRRAWQRQAPSPQRRAGLANALKGMAYASRQLDDRAAEESAYRQLVTLDAAPGNLMLLARCYQDHGKAAAAVETIDRLRQATDDEAVRSQADALLRAMRRDHFGCFRVPRPENWPATNPYPGGDGDAGAD